MAIDASFENPELHLGRRFEEHAQQGAEAQLARYAKALEVICS